MQRIIACFGLIMMLGGMACNSFNYGYPTASTPYFYKRLEGQMGGNTPFILYLHRRDTTLSGMYYTTQEGKLTMLNGKIDKQNRFHLQTNPNSKRKLALTGAFQEDEENTVVGEAIAPAGSMKFQMQENYEKATVIQTRFYEKHVGDCNAQPAKACASVKLDYPEVKNLTNGSAERAINDTIRVLVIQNQSPEEYVSDYVKAYKVLTENEKNEAVHYYHHTSVDILLNEKEFLSIAVNDIDYSGGAHGSHSRHLRNFNTQNGKVLGWQDVFLPNAQLAIAPIGEEYFRKQQKIGDKTWEEAGFWFEDNQFHLSKKFVLLKDRIRFEYSEYEIAPYVMGAPVVEIPYSAIADLLKPEIKVLMEK